MSELENLTEARDALRELARIVKSTQQTLAAMIPGMYQQSSRLLEGSRPGQLSAALQHLENVREGFILSQRTSTHVSLAELRALVRHVLLDWEWLQAMNLALAPADQLEPLNQQLLVYNHALVALATLPHLPASAITFPQRRPTYADVTAPAVPNELLARIEEIERVIYQAEVRATQTLAYDPFRRTYAFFEASTWLVNNYLEPLL